MKIYVVHSKSYDYENELYKVLRCSDLNNQHQIILPHETSDTLFDSKSFLDGCDLVIAEVSYPKIGIGIELGWANLKNVKIICIYKKDFELSGSLKAVSKDFIEYESGDDLISKLSAIL